MFFLGKQYKRRWPKGPPDRVWWEVGPKGPPRKLLLSTRKSHFTTKEASREFIDRLDFHERPGIFSRKKRSNDEKIGKICIQPPVGACGNDRISLSSQEMNCDGSNQRKSSISSRQSPATDLASKNQHISDSTVRRNSMKKQQCDRFDASTDGLKIHDTTSAPAIVWEEAS